MPTVSWVIRNRETKEVIGEIFDSLKVKKLNTNKYEAIPILEYLCSLNRSIKLLSGGTEGGNK